jgi:hypothetical protein
MSTFVLVEYDEELDACELLGMFGSADDALAGVGEAEEERQTLELEDGSKFELDAATSPNVGVLPVGRDPIREFRILVRVAAEDDEEPGEEGETEDTNYYVLEF